MTIRVITPPIAEPISLDDARKHLRITPYGSPLAHEDDDLIMAQLTAAREWCEAYTGRAIAPQEVEVVRDKFPAYEVELLRPPIASIVQVTYIDVDGFEQTIAPNLYSLDNDSEPGWVSVSYGTSWPATRNVVNAMRVRYWAGYSLPSDSPQDRPLPKSIRAAMLLVLGHLYEHRETSAERALQDIPLGAESLLLAYRVRLGMA